MPPPSFTTRPVDLQRLATSGPHCRSAYVLQLMTRGFFLPAHFKPI
ncbi:hypothetical protein PSYMO_31742, partial [Pseudomonas amygdali pv. mori str. 301020]